MIVKTKSWIKLCNSIYLCIFYFFFVFLQTLESFSTLFTYSSCSLVTHIKESCMYLSSQLLFKTPSKTLKLQEKSKKKCILQWSIDLNSKSLPFGVHHGATPWSHWTKWTVKKLNLWERTAIDKSVWIKVWI